MAVPLQIGITGGIGSGKSHIARIFKCLSIPVYDADSRAKFIMTTDGILLSQIKKEFGDLSFNTDGTLNRKYLSAAVFGDPGRLATLNALVHPHVSLDYRNWVGEHQDKQYVLKEAALLFETASAQKLDKVIVVYAPEALRMQRILSRDIHRSESQIREIFKHQLPDEDKIKLADFVILNDESKLVIPQVLAIHRQLCSQRENTFELKL